MKTAVIIWVIVSLACILEACFFTKLDPESKRFLEERENKLNKEENEHKSTS
jgi:hypothetical protein